MSVVISSDSDCNLTFFQVIIAQVPNRIAFQTLELFFQKVLDVVFCQDALGSNPSAPEDQSTPKFAALYAATNVQDSYSSVGRVANTS